MSSRSPQPTDAGYLRVVRPADACLLCGAALNVEGKHTSTIEVAADAEEVVRKDLCPTCWERMGERAYFGFWVTKRVAAPSAKERRLARSERNEALWRLFAALYASDERPNLAPQLFLLAHLLMKYKVLNFAGTGGDGTLTFVHPKLGEEFAVADLPLDGADFAGLLVELESQAVNYAGGGEGEPAEGNPPEG